MQSCENHSSFEEIFSDSPESKGGFKERKDILGQKGLTNKSDLHTRKNSYYKSQNQSSSFGGGTTAGNKVSDYQVIKGLNKCKSIDDGFQILSSSSETSFQRQIFHNDLVKKENSSITHNHNNLKNHLTNNSGSQSNN